MSDEDETKNKLPAQEHKLLVKQRADEFNELAEQDQYTIDEAAKQLRSAFGAAANWTVYGEAMCPWADLPEHNRQNWREVVSVARQAYGARRKARRKAAP